MWSTNSRQWSKAKETRGLKLDGVIIQVCTKLCIYLLYGIWLWVLELKQLEGISIARGCDIGNGWLLCTSTIFELWILYVLWGLIWNEMIDMAMSWWEIKIMSTSWWSSGQRSIQLRRVGAKLSLLISGAARTMHYRKDHDKTKTKIHVFRVEIEIIVWLLQVFLLFPRRSWAPATLLWPLPGLVYRI